MLVVASVLGALVVSTAVAVLRPSRAAVLVVALTGVGWWLVNGPVEGTVLWVVTPTNGLTVADLLVPVALAAAVLALRRDRRVRRAGDRAPPVRRADHG